jgi:hypothetical protein
MEAQVVRFTLPLAHNDRSAGIARRAIEDNLSGSAESQFLADAVLLTSELVTNAFVHTADGCRLQYYFDPVAAYLRVDVHDSSTASPSVVGRPGDVGGLGLRIVDESSTAWGSTATSEGKSVWFELGHKSIDG